MAETKKRTSPVKFVREVRQEARKVTWTSRRETTVATIMVFIMVALAGVFFFVVDLVINFGVSRILAVGA
ncbi:MAG: preprotein translocase subunit SecE [Maricaulaceae bacterium]